MDLYLSNCSKAAQAAAKKVTASKIKQQKEECTIKSEETPIPEVGAARLLDLPLGVKLPVIPGSNNVFYTTDLCKKLYQPSYDFNLSDPYCRLLEPGYQGLHDPHLRSYYMRKDILKRLKRGGFVTSNNKVVCNLKELNKYRHYLTSLKLDFERNYIKEQEIIEKQVNKFYESCREHSYREKPQFQEWLLWGTKQPGLKHDIVIQHRYIDMINKELENMNKLAATQNSNRINEEEKRYQDQVRRKLNVRKHIGEEWKRREMKLLEKIGDQVKREARIEERRRKAKEATDRKKQELLEKKLTYHLRKLQEKLVEEDSDEEVLDVIEYGKGYLPKVKKPTTTWADEKFLSRQKRSTLIGEKTPRIPEQRLSVTIPHDKDNKDLGKARRFSSDEGKKSTSVSPRPAYATRRSSQNIHKPKKDLSRERRPSSDEGYKNTHISHRPTITKRSPGGIRMHKIHESDENIQTSTEGVQGVIFSRDSTPTDHSYYQSCCQRKVTSEELNSIINNVMTWVVAAVTSTLYPVITNYEEKLRAMIYPVSDESSSSSSDSACCCSICNEVILRKRRPQLETNVVTPSIKSERTVTEKACSRKGQLELTVSKYSNTSEFPKLKACRSDSHLLTIIKTSTKKSRDACTETDGFEYTSPSSKKTVIRHETQNLQNTFDGFKYYLKEETKLILENTYQEMHSTLPQTTPSNFFTTDISTSLADADRVLSPDTNISLAASSIVECIIDKLHSLVEGRCNEMTSQKIVSVHFESDTVFNGERETFPEDSTSVTPQSVTLENMDDVAEDMINVILEQLVALRSSNQNQPPHLKSTTKSAYQPCKRDTTVILQRTNKWKPSSAEDDTANLAGDEETPKFVSGNLSQSSLICYIEEVISIILGYIQIELNNDRLIATEETIIVLKILDDVFTYLHERSAEINYKKKTQPSLATPLYTKETNRIVRATAATNSRHRCPFSPVNVPGMAVYPEEERENIERIVKNVLTSSINEEKAELQEHTNHRYLTKGKRVTFTERESKPTQATFDNMGLFKDESCLNKDSVPFSQYEKEQIERVSENIITRVLTEIFKNLPSGHLDCKNGKEFSFNALEKPQDLSYQKSAEQMFSMTEIHVVAQEIVDDILETLCLASNHILTLASLCSSANPTSLCSNEVSSLDPCEIWFESKKKMKPLTTLDADFIKQFNTESEDHINNKIIEAVFQKLNSFICPKLRDFKSENCIFISKCKPDKKAFQTYLTTYTTKVVLIVLNTIQKDLKYNKKNLELMKVVSPQDSVNTRFLTDTEKELDDFVTTLNNSIMTSSLAACICEVLTGNEDTSDTSLSANEQKSKISCRTTNLDQQVLDRIGNALYDMICKLATSHPHSLSSDEKSIKQINETLRTITSFQDNVQQISQAILENIITKLCTAEMAHTFTNPELNDFSECIDTESLSFHLLIQDISKCCNIISSMGFPVTQSSSQDITTNSGNVTVPKMEATKENKLKITALAILKMVFTQLEEFASRSLGILGAILSENEKSGCRNESSSCETKTSSGLYIHAQKITSTILKAIQDELNVSVPELKIHTNQTLQQKQILRDLVNLILKATPLDQCNETAPNERGAENYRYRPTYGNFLPGGANPNENADDSEDTGKIVAREEVPLAEKMKPGSRKHRELKKTLKKIEVELKESQMSPVVPIIRRILNEIFQNQSQLYLHDSLHPDQLSAQASTHLVDKADTVSVSETDVNVVADNVVRIIFQKVYSAAMTNITANESNCNMISFPSQVHLSEQDSEGETSICSSIQNKNQCTHQVKFDVNELTETNVAEDIIQEILKTLETFAVSKAKAYFCSRSTTLPKALPIQQDESNLIHPKLSVNDSHSDNKICQCSLDKSETTLLCQPIISELNICATGVAQQILHEIKQQLDKGITSSSITQNVFKSIPVQVVDTMLDIVSNKGKHAKSTIDGESDRNQPYNIVEKLLNTSDYQKKLELQILDTVENILKDILEKTLDENNLSLGTLNLECNVSARPLGTYSATNSECTNRAILMQLVPKSCAAVVSKDIVAIVIQNISSAIIFGINANVMNSPRLTPIFSDSFPRKEREHSPIINSENEKKGATSEFSENERDAQLKSTFSANRTTVYKKRDTRKFAPDIYEETAHFITKTILNRLKSCATERLDLLFTLDSSSREKVFIGSEFSHCKPNDDIFLKMNRKPSNVCPLGLTTVNTSLCQEDPGYIFANYRRKHVPAINLCQSSLKEYADLITSNILILIKNDIDLEIQKVYSNSNNTSFQEDIIASETVNAVIQRLHDKMSVRTSSFHPVQNSTLLTEFTSQHEINVGQRKMENNSDLSFLSKFQNQTHILSESISLTDVLEEIFRRGQSEQEKMTLLSTVSEILKKAYQWVLEGLGLWPPFREFSNLTSYAETIQEMNLQSRINSTANNIVGSVFRKMSLLFMTSLHENHETKEELALGSAKPLVNPLYFRGLKQAEKQYIPPQQTISKGFPFRNMRNAPLQVAEELVQVVFRKITNFVLLNLEESLSPDGQSNGESSPESGSSKATRKVNLDTPFKANAASLAKAPQETDRVKDKFKISFDNEEITLRSKSSLLLLNESGNHLERKLFTSELKVYARDIVCNILETIANAFQQYWQNRTIVSANVSLSDQIMTANEIAKAVLQVLCVPKTNSLTNSLEHTYSANTIRPPRTLSHISLENPEFCISLDDIYPQAEIIFPRSIFKQIFDKWEVESSDTENEKCELLTTAKAVLSKISTKAKEIEQSISLLYLSPLEVRESTYHDSRSTPCCRVRESQTEINVFGQEIVENLFEKLKLYFLTQMFVTESKETLEERLEATTRSKCHSVKINSFDNILPYTTQLKVNKLGVSSHQTAEEIMHDVMNILEAFVDLQLKHVFTYTFSEIVKTPVENFLTAQQKPLIKVKLQPTDKFCGDYQSSSFVTQRNIQTILQKIHSFHLDLLTYSANTVRSILGIIKNLDKETRHEESSSASASEENNVTSKIISTLMHQCTSIYESMLKNHPGANLFQRARNPYIVDGTECTTRAGTLNGVDCKSTPRQIPNWPCLEETMKVKNRGSSKFPFSPSYSGNVIKPTDILSRRRGSECKPSCSKSEAQGSFHLDPFLSTSKTSRKPFQKPYNSVQAAESFKDIGGENQRLPYDKPLRPIIKAKQIQSISLSPVPHINGNLETIRPLFVSKERPPLVKSVKQKGGKSLLDAWEKRKICKTEGKHRSFMTAIEDYTLLQKWENKYPDLENTATLKQADDAAFADPEIESHEMYTVARAITTCVVSYFKNFKTRGSLNEKLSVMTKFLKEKYESKEYPRNVNHHSVNQFCEQLSELVIFYIISSISNSIENGGTTDDSLEHQDQGTNDSSQHIINNEHHQELYDIAIQLTESLLKEFSRVQANTFNPDHGSQSSPHADENIPVEKFPHQEKEPLMDKAPPGTKVIDRIGKSPIYEMTVITCSDEESSVTATPSDDKLSIDKIVDTPVCEFLQDSICKDIDSNDENLARMLTNAVMEEIFHHQLNLQLDDNIPTEIDLPLKSEDVIKTICKVVETATKECQTLSPYTIMLPQEFLEGLVSALLAIIFPAAANTKSEVSEECMYSEMDFHHLKLVNTIMTEISKDEGVLVQNVESLHPNDEEVMQLVAQTIYNNLLPQFDSPECIQNCISSGCKLFSETIVNLIVQEVGGNQLQNYFSGELTPPQCTEVDCVVENILKTVIQTTKTPQGKPSEVYKLPANIIEELVVNFLSKLLSRFPYVTREQNSSLNVQMKTVISNILNSLQHYLSKSKHIVVLQTKESTVISLEDNETIEKVASSIYDSVLKHSGSHNSVYKDLMSSSSVLSDIIGFSMVKEISNSQFHAQVKEETSDTMFAPETTKIMEKVVNVISAQKLNETSSSPKEIVLDVKIFEEAIALFLAKVINLPSPSSKDVKNLSKHELNKIVSQLAKSVTAEIVKNNISLVSINAEEKLSQESIEIIFQIVDSVYDGVLQQSGTHEALYHDVKTTNCLFPREIAYLLINKILNCPLRTISGKHSAIILFSDLDVGQIVEKFHDYAIKMEPELEPKNLHQYLTEKKPPIEIVPHCDNQPIKIDPAIVAQHLGVISIKTQPIDKLQDQCLTRTGQSIEALRRASMSGEKRSRSSVSQEEIKKEKRVSLDKSGRLNIKPLEVAGRNSFLNLLKPDITKVELLKDVQSKKDLIIRLVTHDIDPENLSENTSTSDEEEVVLREISKDYPKGSMHNVTPILSRSFKSPPLTASNSEASPFNWTEYRNIYKRKIIPKIGASECSADTASSSYSEMRTYRSGEESKSSIEPTAYLAHRILTSSSYNEEDLPSYTSADDERSTGPSAKITEDSLYRIGLRSTSSLKFYTLYQRESIEPMLHTPKDGNAETEKPSAPKQGQGMIKKMSSTLSKMFPKSSTNFPKSFSPSPPGEGKK